VASRSTVVSGGGGIVVEARAEDETEAIIDEGNKARGDVTADPETATRMTRVVADEDDDEEEEDVEDHERPLLLPSALRSSLYHHSQGSPLPLRSSSSASRNCNQQQVLFGTSVGGGASAAVDTTGAAGRKKSHRFPLPLPFLNHANGCETKKPRKGSRRGGGEKHHSWSFGAGDDGDDEDDDPVMTLFHSRANHRVRFCLEQQQQHQGVQNRSKSSSATSFPMRNDGGPRVGPLRRASGTERRRSSRSGGRPAVNVGQIESSSSSSRSLRRFVKSALFGGGPNRQNGGCNAASLAELEAQVIKIQNEEDEEDDFVDELEDDRTAPLAVPGGNNSVTGSLSLGQTTGALLSTPSPRRAKSDREGRRAEATRIARRTSSPQTSPPSSPLAPLSSPSTARLSIRWSQSHKGSQKSSPSPKGNTATPLGVGTSSATSAFAEQGEVRSQVNVLLNKANRAHHVHFRYEYAIKCCMKGKAN
jgi:hypothetical protein